MDKNILEYKGFKAKIEFCASEDLMYAHVLNASSELVVHSDRIIDLKDKLYSLLDDYIDLCNEESIDLYKTYSGKFNFRPGKDLHQWLQEESSSSSLSLNEYLIKIIEEFKSTKERAETCYIGSYVPTTPKIKTFQDFKDDAVEVTYTEPSYIRAVV